MLKIFFILLSVNIVSYANADLSGPGYNRETVGGVRSIDRDFAWTMSGPVTGKFGTIAMTDSEGHFIVKDDKGNELNNRILAGKAPKGWEGTNWIGGDYLNVYKAGSGFLLTKRDAEYRNSGLNTTILTLTDQNGKSVPTTLSNLGFDEIVVYDSIVLAQIIGTPHKKSFFYLAKIFEDAKKIPAEKIIACPNDRVFDFKGYSNQKIYYSCDGVITFFDASVL